MEDTGVFQRKEPVAAEHALQLTLAIWQGVMEVDKPTFTAHHIVNTYTELYQGILKALREGVKE